jgi:hypothetical protein
MICWLSRTPLLIFPKLITIFTGFTVRNWPVLMPA